MRHNQESQIELWGRHRNFWYERSLLAFGATTSTILVDVPPGAGMVVTGFHVSGVSDAAGGIANAQLQFGTTDIWGLWVADDGLSLRQAVDDIWLPCANGTTLQIQGDPLANTATWTAFNLTIWGHFDARLNDQGALPYI